MWCRGRESYAELLGDPHVEAMYNALPNHMHVLWSIKAAEAGNHALCEKPISLTVAEAKQSLAGRDRSGMKIAEAFNGTNAYYESHLLEHEPS